MKKNNSVLRALKIFFTNPFQKNLIKAADPAALVFSLTPNPSPS
jgi:hypothetical protein